MATNSYIVEEGHGHGRGHTQHGHGKGKGHLKHQQDAMADGEYTIVITGIQHSNHTPANQISAPTTLADGSTMFTEVRNGEISTGSAPSNDGDTTALRLHTDNNNGRLRLNDFYDSDQYILLGDIEALNFDYYIQSASLPNQIPVIRLWIDGDGNLATTADRGELVFEWAYQGFGATTQGSWQSADLIGGDWTAWQRSNSQNWDQVVNMTEFSDWADADGFTPVGGVHFDENSLIYGWSVAFGSGNGGAVMYVDDLQVGGVTYEFG